MKKAEEVMNDFMRNLRNMKIYQGIDIMNPKTYNYDKENVHKSFSLEKNIVSTQNEEEIKRLPNKEDEEER